ncbi:MAG: hypothetical protein LWW79_08005 [Holophagaceae bacterium]|nr:hypothetical protein [Holophagaceae bacterium]
MSLARPFLSAVCCLSLAIPGRSTDAAPQSSLHRNVEAYSTLPRPGGAITAHDWGFSSGRLTFQGLNGVVTPLLSEGKVLGFHFRGSGQFSFSSTNPGEWATFTSNHKQNLGGFSSSVKLKELNGQMVLTETVKSFFYWQAGAALPMPSGESTPADAAAMAKEWAYFNRDGLGDRGQDFAMHLANTPGKTLARAEITGTSAPFIHVLDEGGTQLESLWSVSPPANPVAYDGLRRVLQSQQPLGWTWKEPLSPLVNLTHVDINLQANLGSANLKVEDTLVVADQGLSVIALDLYTLRYPEEGRGQYKVSRVLDGAGRPLPFHHRNDRILIEFPAPLQAGEPFRLTFEYSGQILFRPGGDSYWELGLEPWFPQPEMGGQTYTVHALIRTHSKDIPISGGKTLRREKSADGNLLEVKVEKPIQFFTVMAGTYEFIEDTQNGLTIRVAAYGGGTNTSQKRLADLARQIIGFYEQIFEKFPFEEYNIVQVNDVGWGQAPPGMMKITNEAFDGKVDDFSALFTRGINQRFAHEIAHQYWGHLVKMPALEEQWLSESFSNYASALVLRSMKGKGNSSYDGLLNQWRSQSTPYARESTIPFANRLHWINNPRGSYIGRATLLYEKGGLILAALHREMGDNAFAVFMKSLLANFRWKFLTTQSVEQVASLAAKKNYSALFNDCYWGTQMPK